jgi:hypothetical protein
MGTYLGVKASKEVSDFVGLFTLGTPLSFSSFLGGEASWQVAALFSSYRCQDFGEDVLAVAQHVHEFNVRNLAIPIAVCFLDHRLHLLVG